MQRSTIRELVYISIIILLLVFVINGLLSIYFYQKKGSEKLASIEALKAIKKTLVSGSYSLNVRNHNLTRPDSSEKVNYEIATETMQSNKFVYQSWVEFRNADFEGKYMNISGPVRQSVPSSFFSPGSTDTLDIFFLGGSTMFGFNVLDHETIPSQFLQLYKERFPNGKSIRIYNYGTPTYYSYQELILLSDLIFKNHHPDIVVFLDGINDFWFAQASFYGQSYFSYIFRQVFNQGFRTKGDFHLIDTSDALFRDPENIPVKKYNDAVINNYITNMRNLKMVASIAGAETYFFCQPSPFYNYPNQQNDPMCFKDSNTRFDYIYPVLESREDSLYNFTFLGNMLKNEKGYPFIDGLHYSPGFIKKIAERILGVIEKDL